MCNWYVRPLCSCITTNIQKRVQIYVQRMHRDQIIDEPNRDSVRKAREAYLIDRGQTLEPLGLNRRDET